jgi:hypothetical protein
VGCAAGNSRRQLKGEYRSRSKLPSRGPYTDSETLRHRFTTAGIHEPPYAQVGAVPLAIAACPCWARSSYRSACRSPRPFAPRRSPLGQLGPGSEISRHETFTVSTRVQVYFPHPHSSLAAGHNKNPNGLIGQFLPERTDLSPITPADLQKIERKLNGRPRKTLG